MDRWLQNAVLSRFPQAKGNQQQLLNTLMAEPGKNIILGHSATPGQPRQGHTPLNRPRQGHPAHTTEQTEAGAPGNTWGHTTEQTEAGAPGNTWGHTTERPMQGTRQHLGKDRGRGTRQHLGTHH